MRDEEGDAEVRKRLKGRITCSIDGGGGGGNEGREGSDIGGDIHSVSRLSARRRKEERGKETDELINEESRLYDGCEFGRERKRER